MSKKSLDILDKIVDIILIAVLLLQLVMKITAGKGSFITHEEYEAQILKQAEQMGLHHARAEVIRGSFYTSVGSEPHLSTGKTGQYHVGLLTADELDDDYCYINPLNGDNTMIRDAEENEAFQIELDHLFDHKVRGCFIAEQVNDSHHMTYYIAILEGDDCREEVISYLTSRAENDNYDYIIAETAEVFDLDLFSNNLLLISLFPDKFTPYLLMPERSPYISFVSQSRVESVLKNMNKKGD